VTTVSPAFKLVLCRRTTLSFSIRKARRSPKPLTFLCSATVFARRAASIAGAFTSRRRSPLQRERSARKWAHAANSENTRPSSHSDRLAKERRLANASPKSQNEISRQVAATYRSACSRVPVVAKARSPAKRTATPSLGKIRPANDCKIGSTFQIRIRLEGTHQHPLNLAPSILRGWFS
jgi:hypothetical protein